MDYSSLMDDYKPDPKRPFSAIIYGKAGSGKTTLASTFPAPLFIDTNRGLRALAGPVKRINMSILPKASAVNPKPAFDLVYQILQEARDEMGQFAKGKPYESIKTLVIDDLTDLIANYMFGEIMIAAGKDPINGKAGLDEYGALNRRSQTIANLIKDICDRGRFNVILTALPHEDTDDQTKIVSTKPEILGGFRSVAAGYFDEEYYMEGVTVNGALKVTLYASPYKYCEAKTRILKVTKIENPSYAEIQKNLKETPAVLGPRA